MAHIFKVIYNSLPEYELIEKFYKTFEFVKETFKEIPCFMESYELDYTILIGNLDQNKIKTNKFSLGFINEDWDTNFPEKIEGNFFAFNSTNQEVNLITDYSASRSVFYFYNENFIVFSTLQIPIIFFLGDFRFNVRNTSWMISAGITDPFYSWDERIKMIKPRSILTYNRLNGLISIKEYQTKVLTKGKDYLSFKKVLKSGISGITSKSKKPCHLISGGLDSRLLLFLKAIPENLPCITWGNYELNKRGTDIFISQQLQNQFKFEHHVFDLQKEDFHPDEVFYKFLLFSEGRVDQIAGYIDGFALWYKISEMGYDEVIRGDQGFYLNSEKNEELVRWVTGVPLLDDYFGNLNDKVSEKIIIDKKDFVKSPDEKLNGFAKRLRRDYRLPNVLAALNSIKHFFVEVNNPLLNNSILAYSEILDNNKDYRDLYFKKLNKEYCSLPYSKEVSIERLVDIIENKFSEFMKIQLEMTSSEVWISLGLKHEFVNDIISSIGKTDAKSEIKRSWLKKIIPNYLKKKIIHYKKRRLPMLLIAWRLLILSKMYQKLKTIN